MFARILHSGVLVALATAAALVLEAEFGRWPAAGIWVLAWFLACVFGTALLMTSSVGRITWKNRIASYCIPWGLRMNRGRLWPLPVVSWLIWMAIGGAVGLLIADPLQAEPPGQTVRVLLFISWMILGGALMFVLGTFVSSGLLQGRGNRVVLKVILGLMGLIAASVALYEFASATQALWLAGTPIVVLGGFFGAFVLMIAIFGRNIRWN